MMRFALSHLADHELVRDLRALVAKDRSTTAAMIAHLVEIEARRLYARAGYSSLYMWCVGELKLSEHAAYMRIRAARAARLFPGILDALADGRLSLAAVVLVAPYLGRGGALELLHEAAHKSKTELELVIARRFPRPDVATALEVVAPHASAMVPLAPGLVIFAADSQVNSVGGMSDESLAIGVHGAAGGLSCTQSAPASVLTSKCEHVLASQEAPAPGEALGRAPETLSHDAAMRTSRDEAPAQRPGAFALAATSPSQMAPGPALPDAGMAQRPGAFALPATSPSRLAADPALPDAGMAQRPGAFALPATSPSQMASGPALPDAGMAQRPTSHAGHAPGSLAGGLPGTVPTHRPVIVPLAPERFMLRMTVSQQVHAKLRYAQQLLGHSVPDGDLVTVVERALDVLVAKLERGKFAALKHARGGARDSRSQATQGASVPEKRTASEMPGAGSRAHGCDGDGRPAGQSPPDSRGHHGTSASLAGSAPAQASAVVGPAQHAAARRDDMRGAPAPCRARSDADRRHVPATVRREVWRRDGGRCTFVGDDGRRCDARSRLEFDHIEPVARGGRATVDNIRLRCRTHNQHTADLEFGARFMQRKREARRDGHGEA